MTLLLYQRKKLLKNSFVPAFFSSRFWYFATPAGDGFDIFNLITYCSLVMPHFNRLTLSLYFALARLQQRGLPQKASKEGRSVFLVFPGGQTYFTGKNRWYPKFLCYQEGKKICCSAKNVQHIQKLNITKIEWDKLVRFLDIISFFQFLLRY